MGVSNRWVRAIGRARRPGTDLLTAVAERPAGLSTDALLGCSGILSAGFRIFARGGSFLVAGGGGGVTEAFEGRRRRVGVMGRRGTPAFDCLAAWWNAKHVAGRLRRETTGRQGASNPKRHDSCFDLWRQRPAFAGDPRAGWTLGNPAKGCWCQRPHRPFSALGTLGPPDPSIG